jgi:gluconolactonase
MKPEAPPRAQEESSSITTSNVTCAPSATRGIGRRAFLTATATTLAAAAGARTARAQTGGAPTGLGRRYGPGAPPVRYPEPDVVVLDERFAQYKLGSSPIRRIHTGTLWAEGPAWNGVGRYLLWSDIPNDRQLRWLEEDGHVSVLRKPAGFSNGNTFDFQGRQIACEHGTRRVVRYSADGGVTVLAEQYKGKPLNAPNDAVVHPEDGAIWFTDPGYGSHWNYEGKKGEHHHKEAVYRIDAHSGKLTRVTDEIYKPNGLCFSPDYKKLYVADTGASHYPDAPKEIKVWDVVGNTKLARGRTYASMEYDGRTGLADGIRADVDGNIWSSAGWVGEGYDGVHIFAPDGQRIGLIRLPEVCSNVCFGGTRRNRLFMTASQSVYAVYVETRGAHIS